MQGQTAGTGLSERGRDQVAAAATGARSARPAAVVSSDLLRCRQTAAVLAAAAGRQVRLDPALRERSFGRLEGLLWTPARRQQVGLSDDGTVADPGCRPPGGESLVELADRVGSALLRALAGPGPVLVVTHGGPVRVTLTPPHAGMPWGEVPHARPLPVCLRPVEHGVRPGAGEAVPAGGVGD